MHSGKGEAGDQETFIKQKPELKEKFIEANGEDAGVKARHEIERRADNKVKIKAKDSRDLNRALSL